MPVQTLAAMMGICVCETQFVINVKKKKKNWSVQRQHGE